jgi:hypothetical protein
LLLSPNKYCCPMSLEHIEFLDVMNASVLEERNIANSRNIEGKCVLLRLGFDKVGMV